MWTTWAPHRWVKFFFKFINFCLSYCKYFYLLIYIFVFLFYSTLFSFLFFYLHLLLCFYLKMTLTLSLSLFLHLSLSLSLSVSFSFSFSSRLSLCLFLSYRVVSSLGWGRWAFRCETLEDVNLLNYCCCFCFFLYLKSNHITLLYSAV